MMRKTAVCTLLALSALTLAAAAKPPAEPARVVVETAAAVDPGGRAAVEIRLEPKDGIKINRYPMIRVQVPAVAGLVGDAEARVGNAEPPGEDIEANYFDTVQPLQFELAVEEGAARGEHAVTGKLKYYFCVKKSGYCAPKKVDVAIPLTVR